MISIWYACAATPAIVSFPLPPGAWTGRPLAYLIHAVVPTVDVGVVTGKGAEAAAVHHFMMIATHSDEEVVLAMPGAIEDEIAPLNAIWTVVIETWTETEYWTENVTETSGRGTGNVTWTDVIGLSVEMNGTPDDQTVTTVIGHQNPGNESVHRAEQIAAL